MITKRMTVLLAILILGLLPIHLSPSTAATTTHPPNTVYLFVEIEAKVAAGYYTEGSIPPPEMLALVKGRGLDE